MLKKTISLALALALISSLSLYTFADGNDVKFETGNLDRGTVTITYTGSSAAKAVINKDGQKYFYTLKGDTSVPLTMGEGTYKIVVLEKSEDRFRAVANTSVVLGNVEEKDLYIESVQNVKVEQGSKTAETVKTVVNDEMTDAEKVEAVHDYVTTNIKYDADKKPDADYVPDSEEIIAAGEGVCYDYSSVFASMARLMGIPTKLVMGYADGMDGYHAWNEVLIDNEWKTVDTTYDAALSAAGMEFELYKDNGIYKVSKIY